MCNGFRKKCCKRNNVWPTIGFGSDHLGMIWTPSGPGWSSRRRLATWSRSYIQGISGSGRWKTDKKMGNNSVLRLLVGPGSWGGSILFSAFMHNGSATCARPSLHAAFLKMSVIYTLYPLFVFNCLSMSMTAPLMWCWILDGYLKWIVLFAAVDSVLVVKRPTQVTALSFHIYSQ